MAVGMEMGFPDGSPFALQNVMSTEEMELTNVQAVCNRVGRTRRNYSEPILTYTLFPVISLT